MSRSAVVALSDDLKKIEVLQARCQAAYQAMGMLWLGKSKDEPNEDDMVRLMDALSESAPDDDSLGEDFERELERLLPIRVKRG